MIALLCFVLAILASAFKSKSRLEAENAALRHQLIVSRRKVQGRVRLTNNDRWFLIQMYRWFPSILQVITRNHAPDIAAMDLFVVPTIGLDLVWSKYWSEASISSIENLIALITVPVPHRRPG